MTRPAYMIVTLNVSDAESFGKYAQQAGPLLEEYGGVVLAATEDFNVERGSWPRQRLAIIRFPNAERAQQFYQSDGYQAAKELRRSASEGELIVATSPRDGEPAVQTEQSTPHYLLGVTTVTDPAWIGEYMARVPAISASFGVEGLVMGDDFTVLEGQWPRESVVLLKFPSEDTFRAFWHGEEYRAMKELREANTIADHVSFAGLPPG